MPSKIRFVEETHQYFIGKKEVPSVSKLVSYACGDTYANVPESVLKMAQEYGTAVHDAIEKYERGEEDDFTLLSTEIDKYKELKSKYLLKVESMEQMLTDGKNFGGRYDILDQEGNLWDIKTCTYGGGNGKKDKEQREKWSWQLGFYYLGLNKESKTGFIIHLPKKGKHSVILIEPKSNEECKNVIQMFNEEQNV